MQLHEATQQLVHLHISSMYLSEVIGIPWSPWFHMAQWLIAFLFSLKPCAAATKVQPLAATRSQQSVSAQQDLKSYEDDLSKVSLIPSQMQQNLPPLRIVYPALLKSHRSYRR